MVPFPDDGVRYSVRKQIPNSEPEVFEEVRTQSLVKVPEGSKKTEPIGQLVKVPYLVCKIDGVEMKLSAGAVYDFAQRGEYGFSLS